MTLPSVNEPPLMRGRGVALWRQISATLEADIVRGDLSPGSRLPTEAALASQHGVNRHTARRALEALARQGLVRIEQGRGSFVADDVLDYRVGPRTRFSELIRAQDRAPEGRILSLRKVAADLPTSKALQIQEGHPVLSVERLGLADNRPVVLGLHHFRADRFAGLEEALSGHSSITQALEALGVADYRRAWTKLTARLPTPDEAALLRQVETRPIILAEALNKDMQGAPLDYTISRYAAGRVQIVVDNEGDLS